MASLLRSTVRAIESDADPVDRVPVLLEPADRHPAAVYLARLAPGSRRAMRQVLQVIARILGGTLETTPWHLLRYQHTQMVRAQLADRYSAASCAKALAALRGVLRECFRLGLMSAEDHARAVDLDAVRGSRVLRGRALSGAELRALFQSCSGATNQGCRDAALLAVAYGCGLRRSELVHLNIEHYDPSTGAVVVAGKGNKERVVHVANGAGAALATWLARRGTEPGPVFLPVDKRGVIQHRRLTPDAVLVIVRRLAAKSGVARFSPHDLRRSMASDSLDAGVDVVVLQKILGHADVSTSAKYCRRGLRAQRHAAELLQIPVVAA